MEDLFKSFICLMDFQTVLQIITLSTSHASMEEILSPTKTVSTTPQILTLSQCEFISTILELDRASATSARKVSEGLDLTGRLFRNIKM